MGKTKIKPPTYLDKFNYLKIPITPLHRLNRISEILDVDLWIKRDDLFPMFNGGNKARMYVFINKEIEKHDCDAVITAGSTQSNFARVTALSAAANGWRCKLLLHGTQADLVQPKGNLLLMVLSGAEIEIVEKDQIRSRVENSMNQFFEAGYKPYELHGGENITGSIAYYDAVKEIDDQFRKEDWYPEWLIHTSGTGTTQAGLIVGKLHFGLDANIIGISIARRNPRGINIVKNKCEQLVDLFEFDIKINSTMIDFRDNWIGEGYGFGNLKIKEVINNLASYEGIILDPTYTGKAFTGLIDLINNKEISRGSRVLFWHTGGLLNLMASEYIWDETQ